MLLIIKPLCSGFLGIGAAWAFILQWWPYSCEESHRPDVMSAGWWAAVWELRWWRYRAKHGSYTGDGDQKEHSRAPASLAPPPRPGLRESGGTAQAVWDAHRAVPAAFAAALSCPPSPTEATGSLCWTRAWLSFSTWKQSGPAAQPGMFG